MSNVPRKPLVFDTNPFDDERLDDIEFASTHFDASYVPGYSEKRRENEIRASKGQKQIPLPRLQWIRVAKRGGAAVSESDEGMVEWQKLGYRAVGLDDLESFGFKLPPTAYVGSDGLIRRGDVALFVVGHDRAERNRLLMKRLNEESETREPLSGRDGQVYRDHEHTDTVRGSFEELSRIETPKPLE